MTIAATDVEMGQLALALVLEDFQRRVQSNDLTESDVAQMFDAALGRFPPEFEKGLRDHLASAKGKAARAA